MKIKFNKASFQFRFSTLKLYVCIKPAINTAVFFAVSYKLLHLPVNKWRKLRKIEKLKVFTIEIGMMVII